MSWGNAINVLESGRRREGILHINMMPCMQINRPFMTVLGVEIVNPERQGSNSILVQLE